MGQIIQSAFSDAWPLFLSRKMVYPVLLVLAAVCWLFALNVPQTLSLYSGPMTARLSLATNVISALGGLAAWFVIPAAVRTVDPAFKMTTGRFFGVIGIGIVAGLVVGGGMSVLYGSGFVLLMQATTVASIFGGLLMAAGIVFALWIGIRWSQVLWAYFLGDGPNPFAASWRLTAGQFWQTFLFLLVISIVAIIILAIALGVAAGIAVALPPAGFLSVPIGLAIYIWLLNVAYLAEMRWFLRLRDRAATAGGATALAAL